MLWQVRRGLIAGRGALDGASVAAPTDPNFSSVKLLMGFAGSATDESGAAHGSPFTINAPTPAIDSTQFQFGASSALFGGNSGFGYADHVDWRLGAGQFTIECWIRPANTSGTKGFVGQFGSAAPNLGWILYQNGASLAWNVSTTGSDNLTDLSGGTLTANTWAAACVDYNGTKYRLYKDGVMVASSTTARTIFAPSKPLGIGTNSDGGLYFAGNIDEIRLTKGVARYASDAGYTVATVAFPRS